MATPGEETEVKFYLQHPLELPGRILATGGRLRSPRTHEINQRYDTASRSLSRARTCAAPSPGRRRPSDLQRQHPG